MQQKSFIAGSRAPYEAPEAQMVRFAWECELFSNNSPHTTGSGSEGWDFGDYNW